MAGAPAGDISEYSAWREEVDEEVQTSLGFYGAYLNGQMSGFSEALDLSAVLAALQIDDVPKDDWPALTRRCLLIHGEMMKIARREAKRNG